jgi:hypothetical protein
MADLKELLAVYNPRYLLLSSSRSASGPATALLRDGPKLRLQMLTILPGGGAAFTTAPDASRE